MLSPPLIQYCGLIVLSQYGAMMKIGKHTGLKHQREILWVQVPLALLIITNRAGCNNSERTATFPSAKVAFLFLH